MIKKYKISVPKSTLNEIYKKVRNFPWSAAQNMNGWEYGTNLNYLKNISKYWITKYNWKNFEKTCIDRNDPFEKYINEIYENEICVSPIKSLSLHLTNINSSYGLAPFVDYKYLLDEYR